jgi:hypothetical protein
MDGQPGAKEIRLSRITVSGEGLSRGASVTLSSGAQIEGHVYLERDGSFMVVVIMIVDHEIRYPRRWHYGHLQLQ